jgi:hypothetical protein
MGVKKDYIRESVDTILRIDPSLNRDEVEKIVIRKVKEKLSDPTITCDNNVTGANETIKLTELCGFLEKTKPVISGNATFFKQPEELESPTSRMLRNLKLARKSIKKQMFEAQKAGDDDLYQQLDLAQLNAKVIMNAEYGASGTPVAAFYTKYSPAATTLMAQSIITTMAAFFEGYVGDNQKFFHINECIDWMNTVLKKDTKVHKWIVIPTLKEVIFRIRSHFMLYNMEDDYVLENYLNNCSDAELVYIFYANNMKEFIYRHQKLKDLIHNILLSLPLLEAAEKEVPVLYKDRFADVIGYNEWVSREMFLNPYNIPEVIKKDMEELILLMNQYIFVEYLTPDSIVKLNNHKRNTILLVDTDSNVINANLFVSFVMNDLFPGETFHRNKIYNEMICVNMLAAILDHCVIKILDFYGRTHNMGKEARKELTMKNEFMFRRFFLMNKKKRYATSVVLREGNIMVPFKLEIKGLDFIKAGVTEEVTAKFTKMLKDHILFSDDLNLHNLMRDLKQFEREIRHDLHQGGVKFLKPQQYKSEAAYHADRVWQLPVFRAVNIWNEIYPLQKIYSLDRVKTIKTIVTGVTDLEIIKKKYPKEYDLVYNKIFHSSNPEIVKAGLKVISLPSTVQKIPDWIIDLIDYDVIVSDVVGSFRSILEALKIEEVTVRTPNNKANVTSSLISI